MNAPESPLASRSGNRLDDLFIQAGVAELADARDSKSRSFGSVGSRPSAGKMGIYFSPSKKRAASCRIVFFSNSGRFSHDFTIMLVRGLRAKRSAWRS